MKSKTFSLSNSILVFIIILILVILYLPLFFFLAKASSINDFFSISTIINLLADSWYRSIIFFTLKQALISTVLTVVFGFPLAWIVSRYSFIGKSLIKSIFLVPFILPSIIIAMGFILFYGNQGYLNQVLTVFGFKLRILYSFKAILMAHILYNLPIVIRLVGNTLENFNTHLENIASSLGANNYLRLTNLYLPCLCPSILSSSLLIFLYCFMTFGIVLVLGDVSLTTLEVNIYILIQRLFNFPAGMALAFIQMIITLLILFLVSIAEKKNKIFQSLITEPSGVNANKHPIGRLRFIYVIVMLFYVLAPLIAIMIDFFHDLGNSEKNFSLLIYNPIISANIIQVIGNSILVGLLTASITITFATAMALGIHTIPKLSLTGMIAMLPMGISPITFGIGFIFIKQYLGYSSFLLLIVGHVIISFPLVYKIIFDGIKQVRKDLINTARSLGAGNFQIIKYVLLPLSKKYLLTGFIFSFALSLGELGIAVVLQRNFITIPVAIYRFLSARQYIPATGMSIVLMVTALLCFYVFEKMFEGKRSI